MTANTNNVSLIGMPGVGKSTIGTILSKLLGWEYIDTDKAIIKAISRPLSDYIEKEGAAAFKELEKNTICSLSPNHSIISTGGSVVYSSDAMAHLRSISTVIYLENDFEEIYKRILAAPDRGIVMSPGQTMQDLYNERVALYKKYSHLTQSCHHKTALAAAHALKDKISPNTVTIVSQVYKK